jgi:hypothetical protein
MSGAEAIAALGAISACITLVETSKKLLDAARDQHGLPEAFRVVRDQLPMIAQTLQNAKNRSQTAGEDDWKAVNPILKHCKQELKELESILEKVMTNGTDSHLERYKKLVKSSFKGHKVESMAKWIFGQLLNLQSNHVFANVATITDLEAAITKLEKVTPSIDDEDGRYISTGSGAIYVANGSSTQTNHDYGGTYTAGTTMHIGPGKG